MKITVGALIVVAGLFFVLPKMANSADIEWLGIVSGFGGAERETGSPGIGAGTGCCPTFHSTNKIGQAGGRGTAQALGVIPIWGPLGAQASFNYTGGLGSRIGTTFGPMYDFTAGKVGLFATYQHRSLRDANFWWLEPAVDFYLGQMNLSLRYIQPLSGAQQKSVGENSGSCGIVCPPEDFKIVDQAINRLQGTVSYFPTVDFLQVGKDNLELTLGAQVNSFAGPYQKVARTGVGPVFGVSLMPAQNVELTLVRGTVDNRSRYQIETGLRFFFGKGGMPSLQPAKSPTLMELRRKYMEASPYPVSTYTAAHSNNVRR